MAALAVSHVYPLGSRLNERGRLEVGGCDVVELAARVRHARVRVRGGRHARPRAQLTSRRSGPAPSTSRWSTRARRSPARRRTGCSPRRGCPCDVASGGELHLALAGGHRPRADLHARQQQDRRPSWTTRSSAGVGHIVVDSFDEIERLARPPGQRVLLRVTPGHQAQHPRATSRPARPTRSSASRSTRCRERSERCAEAGLELRGLHAHIGSQIFDARGVREARRGARGHRRLAAAQPRRRPRHRLHRRGRARRRSRSTWRRCCGTRRTGVTVLCEPGRSLVGNAGRDALHGRAPSSGSRACAPTWRWTAACPTTCARCSTAPATRPRSRTASAAEELCTVAGHALRVRRRARARRASSTTRARATCSSSPPPAPTGTRWRTTTTRVPRPPVVFCRDGDARVVVRRETYEDLTLRDRLRARSGSACWATARSGAAFARAARGARRRDRGRGRPPAGDRRRAHPQPRATSTTSSSAATWSSS